MFKSLSPGRISLHSRKLRGSFTLGHFRIQKDLIMSSESAKHAVGSPLILARGENSLLQHLLEWNGFEEERKSINVQNTWYSGHSLLSKHRIKASVIHSENAYSFALRSSNNTRGLQTESLINDLIVIDGRYKNLVKINKHIKKKALEHLDSRL